ncbi:MAG: RNA pseudouridine synthase [Spirochaetaceae bacterium]|jgi:23S rRNA pseudouridine1911/1915/1917 synthase|nr:RNA pseudouridine synthase [Spirochaetaceae bacterium]
MARVTSEDVPKGIESRLLYTSGRYLAINKLPGETAEGAGKRGRPFPVTAVHRLDAPVSGCVLFARTQAAFAAASAVFAGNSGGVEKRYWAVVEAFESLADRERPRRFPETGELVHWIFHDGRRNKSIAFDESGPGRRRGALRYRITGRGERYLFLEIALITGRSHQIRAQLAALGLRVKGDLKYGARRSERNGGIRLHARSLSFRNPLPGGEIIRITAQPPLKDRLWEAVESCMAGDGFLSMDG